MSDLLWDGRDYFSILGERCRQQVEKTRSYPKGALDSELRRPPVMTTRGSSILEKHMSAPTWAQARDVSAYASSRGCAATSRDGQARRRTKRDQTRHRSPNAGQERRSNKRGPRYEVHTFIAWTVPEVMVGVGSRIAMVTQQCKFISWSCRL